MDFGNISENLPFIVAIIALVFFQYVLKRRRPAEAAHPDIVQDLLSEVRLNLRLADIFTVDQHNKKFMTTSWQLNRNKLDFLSQPTQVSVSDAFTMAMDFNQQISSAKKFKSTSYLMSIDAGKLKSVLTKSQEGLEAWLNSEVGTTEPEKKVPGVFDDFTGAR